MWPECLEHYKFIKHLFDYTAEKVQTSAFFSVITNFFIIVMGYFQFFCDNIIGVTAGFVTIIGTIMVIDLITGIRAAKANNIERTSKKGLRWWFKLGSYIVFMMGFNSLIKETQTYNFDWLVYPLNVLKLYAVFHILYWETKSIDENLEKLGYSFNIFKLFDRFFDTLKGIFKTKGGIDVEDK